MKCPQCNLEGEGTPCNIVYGIKGDSIEILAKGNFDVAICNGVVIIQDIGGMVKEESTTIITPPSSLILPQEC